MANTKKKSYDTGVYPLPNGNWAYRFKITVDGEIVAQRRSKDIYGVPYKEVLHRGFRGWHC